MSLFDKIQVSLFQSVTTRTAGFACVPQENLTNPSSFVSLILMLIGGSPVGTAGGIKTVTVSVLICSALATIRNKNRATLFNRCISEGLSKSGCSGCNLHNDLQCFCYSFDGSEQCAPAGCSL